jgi:2-methylcitrate dehydratase PrpD
MISRRRLSQGSLTAATLSIRRVAAADSVSPVMATLSEYMAAAKDRALPAEAVEKTKQIVLDTFAAMISGSELPPGKLAINLARVHSGEKVATVAGSSVVRGPIEAALSNGMLAHSDETDDSHAPSLSHPGSSVVPVALAASEQFDAYGARFLRAVALGTTSVLV